MLFVCFNVILCLVFRNGLRPQILDSLLQVPAVNLPRNDMTEVLETKGSTERSAFPHQRDARLVSLGDCMVGLWVVDSQRHVLEYV